MVQYIEAIILPCAERQIDALEDSTMAALVIMDNFIGQITDSVLSLLEPNCCSSASKCH